jgi:hypothetical protein
MQKSFILLCFILLVALESFSQRPYSFSDTCDCCIYKIKKDKVYLYDKEIAFADPQTFHCIIDEYSRDKNSVYFGTKRFKKADPTTFIVLEHGYCKDKYYVYCNFYEGKIVKDADSKTFEVMERDICRDGSWVYTRNKEDELIKNVIIDALTFKRLNDSYYYYDKKFLYGVGGCILARRDTFDISFLLN